MGSLLSVFSKVHADYDSLYDSLDFKERDLMMLCISGLWRDPIIPLMILDANGTVSISSWDFFLFFDDLEEELEDESLWDTKVSFLRGGLFDFDFMLPTDSLSNLSKSLPYSSESYTCFFGLCFGLKTVYSEGTLEITFGYNYLTVCFGRKAGGVGLPKWFGGATSFFPSCPDYSFRSQVG